MDLLEILITRAFVKEGVEDPAILKCIFLAGGPGSGKSYVARNLFNIPTDLPLSSYGLKLINSDIEFEFLLKKQGLSLDLSKLSPEEFKKVTSGPESAREKAKILNKKKLDLYRQQKLGLIIDGTGDTIESIQRKKRIMEIHGYDCFMIFVNTSLDVALERNRKRERKLPDNLVKQIWNKCQENIGHFQNIFGSNFRVVDNTSPQQIHGSVIFSIKDFISRPVQNIIGREWIQNYYKSSNIVPPTTPDDSDTPDEKEDPTAIDFDDYDINPPQSISKALPKKARKYKQ